jgi:hypothetical protein
MLVPSIETDAAVRQRRLEVVYPSASDAEQCYRSDTGPVPRRRHARASVQGRFVLRLAKSAISIRVAAVARLAYAEVRARRASASAASM